MDLEIDQTKGNCDFSWSNNTARRLLFTLLDLKRNCKRHAVTVNVLVIPGTIRTLNVKGV